MARTLTTSSAELTIALCERGVYEPCAGSEPIDLLARGMVESATGSLEQAKDLLSQAYWALDGEAKDRAAIQLAVAYWRGGEKAEATALLDTVPPSAACLLSQALICTDSSPTEALKLLDRALRYEGSRYMRGRIHNQRGMCLRLLGKYGEAVKDYARALDLFRDCPLLAIVENNLGGVLQDLGDREASHLKIDLALTKLEGANLGKTYDQKAQALLNDGNAVEAEAFADCAVTLLAARDHRHWLIEALSTRAKILREQQRFDAAFDDLFRANDLADYLNDSDLKISVAIALDKTSRQASGFYHRLSVSTALGSATSLNSAAHKLGISRQALQDFMRTHGLTKKLTTRRSVITKK